tara:strand:+ start:9792 stop:11642 length:1851 start_codon:yes stop_codon:yes gene_type:complete
MATYYKYAERDASNQVNWSEITSNMVNSLKEVEAIRESKRKAINDATTELSTTLSEAPQGEHSGLNEFAMTYANNAQQMRLMQDQLLKSGQLKLRDYNIGRANLTEGTTQLFNLGKKYQAVYKEKMDRFENGDSGMQEQFQMAELEAFANFSNHEAYINPTNGQVSVGKLISETKSGKSITTMDRTPGSFITVQELNFSVAQKVDKYKLDNLDADIDRLATKYVETFGPNFSIDDVRQMPEFNKMKQEMINKQMALGSQSVGSMLSDYVGIAPNGEAYSYTRDPNKQDENTILLVADPNQPGSGRLVPDFNSEIGKKQYKEAEGFIGREIEKQLGRTETKTEPTPESQSDKNARDEKQQQDKIISNVGKLWFGGEADMQTLTDYFSTLNPATREVKRTKDGVTVQYVSPTSGKLETKTITFYADKTNPDFDANKPVSDSNPKTIKVRKTQEQFIESASPLLTGQKNIRTILDRGNWKKDAEFSDLDLEYISKTGIDDVVEEGLDMEVLDKKLNEKLKDLDFYGEDETMQAAIIDKFKDDFELTITPIDNDKFIIDVAGYEGSVTIEGDFMGISNVEGEKERRKLKAFMKSLEIQKFKKDKGKTNTSTNTGVKPNMG